MKQKLKAKHMAFIIHFTPTRKRQARFEYFVFYSTH